MKRQSLYGFRDWFFRLLIDFLVNSDWIVIIKDFRKSEKRSERNFLGQTNYQDKVIYLDKSGGTSRIFVHELCHFALGTVLEIASKNLTWKDLKKVKGKRRVDKEFEWRELRTLEFERLFYHSLNQGQIKTLRGFIDEARERHRKAGG